ncbi:MAG: hypothetical protein U1E76_12210 [Planctomycetota bacterium]
MTRDLGGMGEASFERYATIVLAEQPGQYSWLLLAPSPEQESYLLRDAAPETFMKPRWRGRPALRANVLIGFNGEDKLIVAAPPYVEAKVLVSDQLPRGALRARPSGAGGVVYVGNWAIELDSGRVLWCLEDLAPVAPLVPAGPRRFLARTATQLIGYGERVAPAVDTGAPASERIPVPGKEPGVVLSSGEFRCGPAAAFPAAELALVDDGTTARLLGSQAAVEKACLGALQAEHRRGLLQHFARCLEFGLVAEARRILGDLQSYELPAVECESLARKLVSRNDPGDATARLKQDARREEERAHYAAMSVEAVRLARWARSANAPVAAAALLEDSTRIAVLDADGHALLRELMPAEFPFRDGADAAEQWARWAAAILPADGRFLAADDACRKRLAPPLWNEGVIALATPNLLLFSRELDPQVVGACLRHGEHAVQLLTQLLPPRKQATERLEIRLHHDRADYLADGQSGAAKPWSTGHYSVAERLSRFYVPRSDARLQRRDLHAVLAHELTHHYIAERWAAAVPRNDQPGYWVVEGMAEFVAEQAVEAGRIGAGLEDSTVRSLDITSAAAPRGWLLPWPALIDGTRRDLDQRPMDDEIGQLTLRHQAGAIFMLTERDLFYAQAASLCFFLVHRCGAAGRAKLIDYLDHYYSGNPLTPGWQALGFPSSAALERAIGQFLDGLRGGR